MPITYNAKSSIINEGTAEIERYVVKITQLAGVQGDEFIRTFPFTLDRRNYTAFNTIKDELPPIKKRSYLGIGFSAYRYNNYIQFYSTYKSFPLKKDDTITFCFENDVKMEFTFLYNNKSFGFMQNNVFPIKDADLIFLSENKLLHWKMTNKETGLSMVGGFENQEGNKQYASEKTGQGLFRKMAKEIFEAKTLLIKKYNPLD